MMTSLYVGGPPSTRDCFCASSTLTPEWTLGGGNCKLLCVQFACVTSCESNTVLLGGALTDSRLSSLCCSGSRSCSVQGPAYGGGSSPSDSAIVGGSSITPRGRYGYVGWNRLAPYGDWNRWEGRTEGCSLSGGRALYTCGSLSGALVASEDHRLASLASGWCLRRSVLWRWRSDRADSL